jgi:hypothetical protein
VNRRTREEKIVAPAGTMVLAAADRQDLVMYKYGPRPDHNTEALYASKGLVASMSRFGREDSQAEISHRYTVAQNAGVLFAQGRITPTEALNAITYKSAMRMVVKMLYDNGTIGKQNIQLLQDFGWDPEGESSWVPPAGSEAAMDAVSAKFDLFLTTYNIDLPYGYTVEEQHKAAFASAAAVALRIGEELGIKEDVPSERFPGQTVRKVRDEVVDTYLPCKCIVLYLCFGFRD